MSESTPDASPASARGLNLVWLLLLALTVLSYCLAESGLAPAQSTPLVLASAALKSLLIGAVFMELLRSAKGLLAAYCLFFAALALSLYLLLAL